MRQRVRFHRGLKFVVRVFVLVRQRGVLCCPSICVCVCEWERQAPSVLSAKGPVLPLTAAGAGAAVGWLTGRWRGVALPLTRMTPLQVFLARLHGNGHSDAAPPRCHVRHLRPRVLLRVVTLHAVQERVAIVASCEQNTKNQSQE